MISIEEQRRLFQHNGFQIFRNAIPADESAKYATLVKAGYGVPEMDLFTRADLVNQVPELSKFITDPRIVERVSACIGDDIRFLQQSDFHANYVAHEWHRDSANRTFGEGQDWCEDPVPYRIAKAMTYLEAKDIALAVLPRSHRFNIPATEDWRNFETYDVLPRENTLDIPLYEDGNVRPVLVEGAPGDMLVFDLRLLHGGRILDPCLPVLQGHLDHPKSQMAIVYGADNTHSHRFHSYTRFVRKDMGYRDLPEQFRQTLQEQNLLLSDLDQNIFDNNPSLAAGIAEYNV